MTEYDFLNPCLSCGTACCKNENPYASSVELEKLGLNELSPRQNGSCILLNDNGHCSEYENRPLECIIFPLDIKIIDGRHHWLFWDSCTVARDFDPIAYIRKMESELPLKYSLDYLDNYVNFHKKMEPKKYADQSYRVLAEVDRSKFQKN